MNRKQFMEQLERLLSDISEAERQEALEYYEGYFDDAGPENEGEVIRELGNPGRLPRSSRQTFRRTVKITGIHRERISGHPCERERGDAGSVHRNNSTWRWTERRSS